MLNSASLGQTIAIVDRSGKVVSTSRHLLDVFKEAKGAYRERKAEIAAARQAQADPGRIKPPRRSHTVAEDQSVATSRRSHRHGEGKSRTAHRRHSASPSRRRSRHTKVETSRGSISGGKEPMSPPPEYPFPSPPEAAAPSPGAAEKAIDLNTARRSSLPLAQRPRSTSSVDMDLAYGEAPPNLFETEFQEAELHGLVGKVRGLLDEANCLQYSATQTIQTLQHNPDAMAAIALTLAEISNLIKKMAPGAMLSVRNMAPAVFALLSSPQFLVAAGVGVGVTIVAFGGYKIVRKIQERRAENDAEELMEIRANVSRIDTWRRGVASSDATSVEGEFISPTAARLAGLSLDTDVLPPPVPPRVSPKEEASRSNPDGKQHHRHHHRSHSATMRPKSVKSSGKAGSVKSSGSSSSRRKRSSSIGSASRTAQEEPIPRVVRRNTDGKKAVPSPLRLMFR